jgi:hypothetical protein
MKVDMPAARRVGVNPIRLTPSPQTATPWTIDWMNYARGKRISKARQMRTPATFKIGGSKLGRTVIPGSIPLEIPLFQSMPLPVAVDVETDWTTLADGNPPGLEGPATAGLR